jgi:hypothetical protein
VLLVAVLCTVTSAPAEFVVNDSVVELPLFQLIVAVPALFPLAQVRFEPDPDALIVPDVAVPVDWQLDSDPVNV